MADATVDLATVWDQIRERLATSLSPQQNAMLNLTRPVGVFEDTAVLSAPNEFTQTVLESDRKSTRLNSSHANISYAVFCLKTNHLYQSTDAFTRQITPH